MSKSIYIGISLLIFGLVFMVKKNLSITDKYDVLFIKYANKHGLNWKMLKAIALNESSLGKNKGYEPIGGTVGLMQIKLSTARDYYPDLNSDNMNDDEVQVMSASAFIADLFKKTKGDTQKTVMSYNQGLGNTLKGKTYAQGYYDKYLSNMEKIA